MSLDEFTTIERYFRRIANNRRDVLTGIGDDGAIVTPPLNQRLVMVMDTLIAGVHFPLQTSPYDIAYKALAVNLSDLAAMGAEPAWIMLALTLPHIQGTWLAEFCAGLKYLLNQYNLQLIGGDTTRGTLAITVQASGFLPFDKGLLRSGAKPGDLIYVTGCLGDAGLALQYLQGHTSLSADYLDATLQCLNRPTPRIAEGLFLRDFATATIDVSDGLAADLEHILQASRVGATLYLQDLPLSAAVQNSVSQERGWRIALAAGDDYELCFTIPAAQRTYLEREFAQKFSRSCRCIGVIEKVADLRLQLPSGELFHLEKKGYQHFN